MNSNNKQIGIADNNVPKPFDWKRKLVTSALEAVVGLNLLLGAAVYGLRAEGHTAQELRDNLRIRAYDEESNKIIPWKYDPIYFISTPGRELGLGIYDLCSTGDMQDTAQLR